MASVLQINISPGGIPKRPIDRATVRKLGLEGDSVRNTKYHGGPLQALLLIMSESLDEMKALGFPVFPGALGENLTTLGLDRRELRVGQQYRIGEVILELTKVRVPCSTLNPYGPGIQKAIYDEKVKAGDPSSPKWGLSGFYTSVVQEGTILPGDSIQPL